MEAGWQKVGKEDRKSLLNYEHQEQSVQEVEQDQ